MHWPIIWKPVPKKKIPFFNFHYLQACPQPVDPTIVWGTQVPAQPFTEYSRECARRCKALISPAHVLLQAVGHALQQHPVVNRRVVGRRIHDFRNVNVRMMTYDRQQNEVDILLLRDADSLSLKQIARTLWENQLSVTAGETTDHEDKALLRSRLPGPLLGWGVRAFLYLDSKFNLPKLDRIDRTACSPVVVNYLAFAGAPPMRTYKPSKYPHESSTVSITMGRTEEVPVVRDGKVETEKVAPLFVRADHRIVSAYELGEFIQTLRTLLAHPAEMDRAVAEQGTDQDQAGAVGEAA